MAFVERVQDTLAVQKFFVLYARAVDTRDWADTDIIVYSLYESLFTEDAVLDYASGMMLAGVNWSDAVCGNRKKAVNWISTNFKQNFGKTQHLISNIDIEWDGSDAAHVRAMFYNPLTLRGLPLTRFITLGGWYIHELVRCPDGKWRSKFLRQEIAFFSLLMGVLQYVVIGLLLAYLLWKA